MKTLINMARPVVMTTNREPLDLQLSIKQRSGDPLTQTQDATANTWSPDRTVTPLLLDPDIKAYDPEKRAFITISTASINWYVGEIKDWDSSTETGLVGTSVSSQNYYLEYVNGSKTGSLVVRKNINYNNPVTIICKVEFTDSSRSQTYRVEATVMLTTENRPDEFYNVSINTPSTIEYRPFTDSSSTRNLKAVTSKGNTLLDFPYTNGIKYFWYYLNAGAWTLIPTNGTYAPYVSGQNTDTLILDAAYVELETIKVMIAKDGTYTPVGSPSGNPKTLGYFEFNNGVYYPTSDTSVASGKTYYTLSSASYAIVASPTGNPSTKGYYERIGSGAGYSYTPSTDTSVQAGKTYFTQTTSAPDCDAFSQVDVARVLPRIEALPYCTGGSAINVGDSDRVFEALVSMDAVDMSDALREEYIRLNWKSKPTNSNTVTDRGWGNSIEIPASELQNTGNVNTEVYCDIGVLGPLGLLTDDSPGGSGYVTDDSPGGSGYVIGRV